MSVEEVLAAFERSDSEALINAVADLSDDERAMAWEAAAPRGRSDRWENRSSHLEPAVLKRVNRVRALLSLGVGPQSIVKQVGWYAFGDLSPEEIKAVAALRDVDWRMAMAAESLHTWASEREVGLFGPFWWDWWERIRTWVRTGALPIDTASADYLVVMIRGLTFSDSIENALLQDRALMDLEVWLLFEPGDGVQRALMGADRYWDPANTWRASLVRLALKDELDADRLRIEATRAAADETMARNHRAWYRRIPTMLDVPTSLPEPATSGRPPPGNQLQRYARGRRSVSGCEPPCRKRSGGRMLPVAKRLDGRRQRLVRKVDS